MHSEESERHQLIENSNNIKEKWKKRNNKDFTKNQAMGAATLRLLSLKFIHVVLVNDEEVNATLLNVDDAANIYLYIEHSGACSLVL